MADVTRRFRSAYAIPYAQALLVLVEHARSGKGSFVFGPLKNVAALRHNGLTVSGPEAVVGAVALLLEQEVPGLYELE